MSIRRAQDERLEGTPDGLNAITEIMDVPDAPTIGTATDLGTGSTASVTFTAATTGGTATTYTVTSTPGSITGTGASSPITVSGLSVGTAYTFKVKGTNATGVVGPESVASNSLTLAFPFVGAYDALFTTTLSGNASSVTLANIPAGYKHLQLRILTKWGTAYTAYSRIQFNGDTGTNYAQHRLEGYGASASSAGYTGETSGILGINSDTQWGASITDILDYASPDKYTTVRTLGGYDNNGAGGIALSSSLWRNTSPVTSIVLLPSNGVNFVQYSSFALYGVK